MCGRCFEHLKHLPSCSITRKARVLVRTLLKAMGLDPSTFNKNPKLFFGFGLDNNNNVIKNKAAQALLRLYWRVIYRHMTRVSSLSHTPWFVSNHLPNIICKDLARVFMEKILTYQLNKRDFYYQRVLSELSPDEEILPLALVDEASPLGSLDIRDGKLVIRPDLVAIFKCHECWSDFNSK